MYRKCYFSFWNKEIKDDTGFAQSHKRNFLELGLNERFQFLSVVSESRGFAPLMHLSLKGTGK